MIRATALFSAFLMLGMEPVLPIGGDFDLVKYGLTQGGLVLVVCVLLWFYRRDYTRLNDNQGHQLDVMTNIVANATAALTRSAEASDRMARAVETLQHRRS